ncbi:SRPBCC family protein [Robiginitalea sp. SC105]|uniref:SRPBCC family protein n=1 Tax=Robiginitalea sp. SC105 TaxID=2762332 RepID=UPI001639A03F|nr:SRPBCC family protein [Robiginitalea sp. SC105]MBC2839470.1 SRPBCC family protein [Robiginitalea sp. SC105]
MTFIYILAAILVLLIALYLIAPARYDVSRSIRIDRPPGEVFEYLKYLKNQDEWSPWSRRDPDMKKDFRGTDGTVGAVSSWEGNKEVGAGEQELTRIEEGTRIESQLRFLKPWKSTSDAYLEVEPAPGDGSKVRWGFSGQSGFPMRLMMLVISMDKMVGKDFEEGLASLKAKLEGAG